METILNFLQQTGFYLLGTDLKVLIMIVIALVLAYLAIVKQFEPLLLLPIAFGMLLTNLPGAEMFHEELFAGGHVHWDLFGGAADEAGKAISVGKTPVPVSASVKGIGQGLFGPEKWPAGTDHVITVFFVNPNGKVKTTLKDAKLTIQ